MKIDFCFLKSARQEGRSEIIGDAKAIEIIQKIDLNPDINPDKNSDKNADKISIRMNAPVHPVGRPDHNPVLKV